MPFGKQYLQAWNPSELTLDLNKLKQKPINSKNLFEKKSVFICRIFILTFVYSDSFNI